MAEIGINSTREISTVVVIARLTMNSWGGSSVRLNLMALCVFLW